MKDYNNYCKDTYVRCRFVSGLYVMFPKGGKRSRMILFFGDSGLEAMKRLQISGVSELHSRFYLSKSKL